MRKALALPLLALFLGGCAAAIWAFGALWLVGSPGAD